MGPSIDGSPLTNLSSSADKWDTRSTRLSKTQLEQHHVPVYLLLPPDSRARKGCPTIPGSPHHWRDCIQVGELCFRNTDDLNAVERHQAYQIGIFAEPIYNAGDWPELIKSDLPASILPRFNASMTETCAIGLSRWLRHCRPRRRRCLRREYQRSEWRSELGRL